MARGLPSPAAWWRLLLPAVNLMGPLSPQQLGAVNCVLQNPEYFFRENAQFFPKCHENCNDGNK